MALPTKIERNIQNFKEDLRFGNILDSAVIAKKTLEVLKSIICTVKWANARELLDIIKEEGCSMIEARPVETAVGNMVRRVMKIVREDYATLRWKHAEGDPQESLQKMLLAEGQVDDYRGDFLDLKEDIIESIDELFTELETSMDNIAAQALEHIYSEEVVMTAGKSRNVECFLKAAAAKERKFQVIVTEGAPFYHGQEMAKNLSSAGIETIVIPDSAAFAIMSRVNKVIVGTHSVMANGGLKATSGLHSLALAAKHYSVPFIVCAAMFKLTPQFVCSYDQDAFNLFLSPQDVMPFAEGDVLSDVEVSNPVFDYVPPELVTLFVSNIGGNAPTYVYRLMSELYHPDDYSL